MARGEMNGTADYSRFGCVKVNDRIFDSKYNFVSMNMNHRQILDERKQACTLIRGAQSRDWILRHYTSPKESCVSHICRMDEAVSLAKIIIDKDVKVPSPTVVAIKNEMRRFIEAQKAAARDKTGRSRSKGLI
jgi:hypothetical protein